MKENSNFIIIVIIRMLIIYLGGKQKQKNIKFFNLIFIFLITNALFNAFAR